MTAFPERRAAAARGHDLYQTPKVAVDILIDFLSREMQFPNHVWEPACGAGAIAGPLREAGAQIWATDIQDFSPVTGDGPARQNAAGLDFCMAGWNMVPPEFRDAAIITNPPFGLAQQFLERALALKPPLVAFLLRGAFDRARRRHHLFTPDYGYLGEIKFIGRLPSMHRQWLVDGQLIDDPAVKREKHKYAREDYYWLMWDPNYRSAPQTWRYEVER